MSKIDFVKEKILEQDESVEKFEEAEHSFREGYFIFSYDFECDYWYSLITNNSAEAESKVSKGLLYYCEGSCSDIIDKSEVDARHWITCHDCDDMPVMTHDELLKEMNASYDHLKFFDTWWKPYKLRIKKSCLKYGEDYPSWITLGDDYLDYVKG